MANLLPDVLLLAFVYLALPVGLAVALYWIVRLAIRHELRDRARSHENQDLH
jgi:hypothetical protein